MSFKISRRNLLKVPVALGGLAMAGALGGCNDDSSPGPAASSYNPTTTNSLISSLPPYYPGTETLGANEMRITFLGTSPIPRLAQECSSVYIEVGNGPDGPLDQFIFDMGSGVIAKYTAMGIPMRRMDKVFLTHLHGDHTSDLIHLHAFGPSADRKWPLYIWGPSRSNFTYTDPNSLITYGPYEDGTNDFCTLFRQLMRWHSESFSFLSTAKTGYDYGAVTSGWGLPGPVAPVNIMPGDDPNDGFSVIPIELDWTKKGDPATPNDNIAYNNAATGVKITHFPAIHCRRGSISYKLEWNGLKVVFSGDTKPNYDMTAKASGIDVLIHEMVVPADVWAMKNLGITNPNQVDPAIWNAALNAATEIQNSSHTPQGAFGYILSQLSPAPRLAVATHFQATDDTMASAMNSVRAHYQTGAVTFAADFMVLNITPTSIRQRRAVVSNWAWYPVAKLMTLNPPKYPDATTQIDTTEAIPSGTDANGNPTYRADGY